MKEIIKIQGLNKTFRSSSGLLTRKADYVHVLKDIYMTVYDGEIVGIVGESGSGKTTLARIILNLILPDNNSILVDNVNLSSASKSELRNLRKQVAVVFQDPVSNLNPRQRIASLIMRPLRIHGHNKQEAWEKTIEAINKVKLNKEILTSFPHQLSGGQLQRVAIARALVLKPKIMILDEPTSALDISIQAQILNLLIDLQKDLNLTLVIISHDLNVVNYISDRVFVMYLGKIVEYGKTNQVMKCPAHQYTKGLMSAAPILNPRDRKSKKILPGEPGKNSNSSTGCNFCNRCDLANTRCYTDSPPLFQIEEDHFASCFLADNLLKKYKIEQQ